MKNRWLLAALLLFPAQTSAQTNGFVLQCLSARTSGAGCVTRAQANAPTSLFRDPAGIAFMRPSFEMNVAPFIPVLTFENHANRGVIDGATHAYPMASAAYVGAPWGGRVAWAIGLEPIGGFGSDFRLRHPLLSGTHGSLLDYESFFAAAKIGPSLALRLTPSVSVGASINAVYAQIRKFRMPFTMPPAQARGLAGIPMLDPQVYGPLFQQFTEMSAYGDSEGYDGLTWAADAGVAYHQPNGLALSVSWSKRRAIEVDGGSAVIDLTAQFGQMMQAMIAARAQAYHESAAAAQAAVLQQLSSAGLDLSAGMQASYAAATTITLPQTIGAGISLPVHPRLRIAAEVEWREWSRAQNTMPFNLTGGTNANINLMLNADPGNGRFDYPFPLDWQDSWSVKVGATYAIGDVSALRFGYLHGDNPVPDHTVFITFPAISTQAATAGATLKIGSFPLDLSYVHSFEATIAGTSGTHKLGSEYVQSRTTMKQRVLTIGTMIPLGGKPAI